MSDLSGSLYPQLPDESAKVVLGRVCKVLQPEHDSADVEHREVVSGALFVAGGDAAELFQAVEQMLHPVARSIGLAVEAGSAALAALSGDHRPDAAQVLARGPIRKKVCPAAISGGTCPNH
jgi:hypothetical protein